MENTVLAFTIILSFVGITISLASLVLAIIYIIQLNKIAKIQDNLNLQLCEFSKLKDTLILDCGCIYPLYPKDKKAFEVTVSGRKLIDWLKQKYNIIDDLQAVNIYKSADEHKLIEKYIEENLDNLHKEFIQ